MSMNEQVSRHELEFLTLAPARASSASECTRDFRFDSAWPDRTATMRSEEWAGGPLPAFRKRIRTILWGEGYRFFRQTKRTILLPNAHVFRLPQGGEGSATLTSTIKMMRKDRCRWAELVCYLEAESVANDACVETAAACHFCAGNPGAFDGFTLLGHGRFARSHKSGNRPRNCPAGGDGRVRGVSFHRRAGSEGPLVRSTLRGIPCASACRRKSRITNTAWA